MPFSKMHTLTLQPLSVQQALCCGMAACERRACGLADTGERGKGKEGAASLAPERKEPAMVYDSDVIRQGVEGWLFSKGMESPEAREQVADNVLLFIASAQNIEDQKGGKQCSQSQPSE